MGPTSPALEGETPGKARRPPALEVSRASRNGPRWNREGEGQGSRTGKGGQGSKSPGRADVLGHLCTREALVTRSPRLSLGHTPHQPVDQIQSPVTRARAGPWAGRGALCSGLVPTPTGAAPVLTPPWAPSRKRPCEAQGGRAGTGLLLPSGDAGGSADARCPLGFQGLGEEALPSAVGTSLSHRTEVPTGGNCAHWPGGTQSSTQPALYFF